MLANPVCFVGYAAVLWKFFHSRIKCKSDDAHLVPHLANDNWSSRGDIPRGLLRQGVYYLQSRHEGGHSIYPLRYHWSRCMH